MRRTLFVFGIAAVTLWDLSACGGGGSPGGSITPPPTLVSYVGTTGVFAAWADPSTGSAQYATVGSYAGKRQVLHGQVDFQTGQTLGQPAGIEVYKGSDGHIYALDLTSTGTPGETVLSSETAATVDDTCSLSGTQVTGANTDYIGVDFVADLANPTNSSYLYRLPGPDGVCNTTDDVVHMVKTGMGPNDAPITVSAMPVAAVRSADGGLAGFIIKSGSELVETDSNLANPVVLGSFAAPIGVAVALPVGTTQGYPTGGLYVVDGNIVYVDYVGHSVSAPLYTIPNWTPTNEAAAFAASPNTLYFSINTPASGATAASAAIYAMPADGSAAPAAIDREPGRILTLSFPIQGTDLVWAVANPTFEVESLPAAGGSVSVLATTAGNAGTLLATATTVYYTDWLSSYDGTTKVSTRSNTETGIVGLNGTVVQAPLANSTFVNGGEQAPWPNDTTTTQTPYLTLLQVQGLTPVAVTNATTGEQFVVDGVSGGTLIAIDAATNQPSLTLGTLPTSTAAALNGTFRGNGGSGFIEANNSISTNDPASRDLYFLNTKTAGSLVRVTGDL